MPGVSDAIRRTQSSQNKAERKKEMAEIFRMVREGRLHEADEHQMETLNLALELNKILGQQQISLDPAAIQEAVKSAIGQALQSLPAGTVPSTSTEGSRPSMKHVSLSDIGQEGPKVEISNSDKMEGEASTGEENSASKLEMLKKIKGNG